MGDFLILAQRIKKLRISLDLTQREFARKAGCTAATLSAYENGSKSPSLEIVKGIAETFNVSIDWLCGLSDKKDLKHQFQTYGDIASVLFDIDLYTDMILDIDTGSFYSFLTFEDSTLRDFIAEWKEAANVLHNTSINKEITQTMYNSWKKTKLEELSKKKIKVKNRIN